MTGAGERRREGLRVTGKIRDVLAEALRLRASARLRCRLARLLGGAHALEGFLHLREREIVQLRGDRVGGGTVDAPHAGQGWGIPLVGRAKVGLGHLLKTIQLQKQLASCWKKRNGDLAHCGSKHRGRGEADHGRHCRGQDSQKEWMSDRLRAVLVDQALGLGQGGLAEPAVECEVLHHASHRLHGRIGGRPGGPRQAFRHVPRT
mmetsp:Transcript_1139/g.4818  ORF Transcript_1139/g.4818 Transcript_1139/m.4818 type:complete len:205 (+) Transcript_1139:14246-14860(+)